MVLKRHAQSWGEEIVIGEGARVVRIYVSAKKVTVDLSQVRDMAWDKFIKVQAKYPACTKIELAAGTDVQPIIQFWMGEAQPVAQPTVPGFEGYVPGSFRWCSYWHTWNYVLSVHGHRVREFALTPVNAHYPETWNDREFYRVREHCTSFGEHDECVRQLPADVLATIEARMGKGWVDRMIAQHS